MKKHVMVIVGVCVILFTTKAQEKNNHPTWHGFQKEVFKIDTRLYS